MSNIMSKYYLKKIEEIRKNYLYDSDLVAIDPMVLEEHYVQWLEEQLVYIYIRTR